MIQTKRLIIKPFSEEDAEAIFHIMTNESVKQTYLVPDFTSKEQGLKTANRLIALSHDSKHCVLGVYLGEALIGFLNDVEMENDSIEMGYVISPAYQNQGYATEAFGAVITYLFSRGFREVIAGAFAENLSSIRVMEKCGMKRMAKRADIEYRGKLHRCVYYAIEAN
jgi:RimJ/RimL family protein N-acetyltransferase